MAKNKRYKNRNYYNNRYYKNKNSYVKTDNASVESVEPVIEEVTTNNNEELLEKYKTFKKVETGEDWLNDKTIAINPELIHENELPKLKGSKGKFKLNKFVIGGIGLLVVILGIISFVMFRNKFKDGVIEFGTQEVSVDDFLVSSIYKKKSSIVRGLENVDFSKVGEYDVTLKYKKKEQNVKLKIVDTTPPVVRFQNITQYTNYEINGEDFILSIDDLSPTEVSYEAQDVDTSKYKDYTVKVKVKDIYGNETSEDCLLSIGWLKKEVVLELGSENTRENLVVNVDADAKKVPKDILNEINTNEVGVYQYLVDINYDGEDYNSTIKVEDTTPPVLELKDVTVYNDKTTTKDAFIKKASDNSGKVTINLLTEMKFGEFGTQEIVIEAVDPSGNKTQGTAYLYVKKDTTGPKFSGLSDLTVDKNSSLPASATP